MFEMQKSGSAISAQNVYKQILCFKHTYTIITIYKIPGFKWLWNKQQRFQS